VQEIKVWDIFLRTAHWALAIGFLIAYLSAEEVQFLHEVAGYIVAAVVILRVIWGVVGPRRARFADFVYRPRKVLSYLRDMLLFRSKRYLGHSPAGGAMVVALLVMLAVTTATGMAQIAIEEGKGPLAPWLAETAAMPGSPSENLVLVSDDEETGREDGRRGRSFVGGLHEAFANITLYLVIAHLAGVALASIAHRENLPRAMVTGRKRAGDAVDL